MLHYDHYGRAQYLSGQRLMVDAVVVIMECIAYCNAP